jgi:site-specific recombinase XerD
MNIAQLIDQYIEYRQSLGEKFKTNATILKAFCSFVVPSTQISAITDRMLHKFLYKGEDTVTSGWFVKHTALLGFYKYAVSRNYITEIPLPKILPKRPPPFVPYIFSKNELKCLFDTAFTYQKNRSHVEPHMVHTVLVLMYALGLRPHETLSLRLGDLDMDSLVIIIQESKHYKSRLVPFNQQIKDLLNKYFEWRSLMKYPQALESAVFIDNRGTPFKLDTMHGIFQRIRAKSQIHRADGATFQPRMHDLRHTFAVNRLTGWYQENKDVQQLLPVLSVYLGHTHLAHTSVYLSMTDQILQSASDKFERYVFQENHHEG